MATLVGVLVVVGGGLLMYRAQLAGGGVTQIPPQQQIDLTGIRSELLQIGQVERQYSIAHGAYGTLPQLREDGAPSLGIDERGYAFAVEPDGARGFKATATPIDPDKPGWPTLVMDETMQIGVK